MCHQAFGDTNYNKTITALFKNWPKERLAQFYTDIGTPSFSTCTNFFRITIPEIFSANIKFKVAEGKVFTTDSANDTKNEVDSYADTSEVMGLKHYENHMLKKLLEASGSAGLVMEIAWRKRKWLSQNLIRWLDEYRPQAVFCYIGYMAFYTKIAYWISQRYNIPLFLYTTDDYTYCTHVYSPFAWLHHFYYMKWFKRSLCMAKRFYASSPGMRSEYSRKFAINNDGLILNCVHPRDDVIKEDYTQNPIRLIYTGNLYIGRWKILSYLADCLLELRNHGFYAVLDIYSERTPRNEILIDSLNKHPVSAYKGSLNQEDMYNEIDKSNVLVHVESWDYIRECRLSISTKISDYMASNRMILAIGPEKVESMRYLQESDAALCINTMDKDKIVAMLKDKLFDADYRKQLAERGKILASENHGMLKIQSMLYKDLCELVKKGGNI